VVILAPTYGASPVTHLIKVGANGLTYSPSNISANVGDLVTLYVVHFFLSATATVS